MPDLYNVLHLSLRCRHSCSRPQNVIQRCESRPRIFFSHVKKNAGESKSSVRRSSTELGSQSHRVLHFCHLSLHIYFQDVQLVALEFWFLLNEQVYCNVLVGTIHVHMQRHTLSLSMHWHISAPTYICNAFALICACVCLFMIPHDYRATWCFFIL